MTLDQLFLYSLVIFSVSIVPGPSMILAFKEGAMYRATGTFPSAIGNVTASLIQALIAFFVFHSLVSITPQAQGLIQLLGACFICYVGYIFIANGRHMRLNSDGTEIIYRPRYKRFMDGFVIALFNPKAIMFFIALFPQFTGDMEIGSAADLLQTFVPVGLVALLCFMGYGMLGQSSRLVLNDQKIFGVVIPALGWLMILIAIFATFRYFVG